MLEFEMTPLEKKFSYTFFNHTVNVSFSNNMEHKTIHNKILYITNI